VIVVAIYKMPRVAKPSEMVETRPAELIFCMTESQRQTAMKMFPEASSKLLCLQPNLDIEDPHNGGAKGLVRLAKQVQDIMPRLVDHLLALVETLESA
jgi:protein-tyrosine-phosphatase